MTEKKWNVNTQKALVKENRRQLTRTDEAEKKNGGELKILL